MVIKKIEGKKGKKLSMGKKVYTRMYMMGKKGEDEGWEMKIFMDGGEKEDTFHDRKRNGKNR